jgi:hypothetical protein
LKQEKFDPVLLNLIGGKSWRIKGKNLGLFAINNVLASTKTGGYEQARNANFRQLNQDVSSGTLLGTNTFTAMEEPISLTSTSILNIKTHLMKSTL